MSDVAPSGTTFAEAGVTVSEEALGFRYCEALTSHPTNVVHGSTHGLEVADVLVGALMRGADFEQFNALGDNALQSMGQSGVIDVSEVVVQWLSARDHDQAGRFFDEHIKQLGEVAADPQLNSTVATQLQMFDRGLTEFGGVIPTRVIEQVQAEVRSGEYSISIADSLAMQMFGVSHFQEGGLPQYGESGDIDAATLRNPESVQHVLNDTTFRVYGAGTPHDMAQRVAHLVERAGMHEFGHLFLGELPSDWMTEITIDHIAEVLKRKRGIDDYALLSEGSAYKIDGQCMKLIIDALRKTSNNQLGIRQFIEHAVDIEENPGEEMKRKEAFLESVNEGVGFDVVTGLEEVRAAEFRRLIENWQEEHGEASSWSFENVRILTELADHHSVGWLKTELSASK